MPSGLEVKDIPYGLYGIGYPMIGDFMGCGPLPVRDPSYRKGPFGFDKGQSFVGK